MSGVGAIVGGSGGYFVGSALEKPAKDRQRKVDNNISITIINKND